MRKCLWVSLALIALLYGRAFAFDIEQVPNFEDGTKWEFVREQPFSVGLSVSCGKLKWYRLREDPTITGSELFPFKSGIPFYKNWGRRGEQTFFHSIWFLKQKDPEVYEWVSGVSNSPAHVKGQVDRGKRMVIWIQIAIYVRGNTYEIVIPNPEYYKTFSHPRSANQL
ncbi:MAG: hypothetical protein HY001_04805 [Candidatus Portnoybacteria bacterium]|nr:hypothetical protein [Candidatus Portnoybacteria bacterium]